MLGGGRRELWRRIAFAGGARAYSLVAAVVMLVITARVLGAEGRGIVAASVTWTLLFATLGHLSLGQVALHQAAGRPGARWLPETIGSLLAITVVMSFVGWGAAALLYVGSGGEVYGELPVFAVALGFAALPFLIYEQYVSSLLMAVDRLDVYNRAQVVGRTFGIAFVIVLVAGLRWGVAGALIAVLLAQAIVALQGTGRLVALAGGRVRLARSSLRPLLAGGVKLHLNAIGTFLFTSASILIVQYYRGPEETAFFQIAVQLTTAALIIPQGASLVLFSEIARVGPDAAWRSNRHVLAIMTLVVTAVAGAGALLAPVVLPLLLGDEFSRAVPVFQLLTLALIGQTFSIVMGPQWIGRGLFWQASLLTLAVGILNVVACLLLVPRFGMQGAAVATLGVYGISVVGNGTMAIWVQLRVSRGGAVNGDRPPTAAGVVPLIGPTREDPA